MHADVIVGGQGGREGKSQELVAEGNEGGSRPRSSKDIGQHAGATHRYDFNIAKQLALCDVGPAERDVLAAFAETDIPAESNGCGVILIENSRRGLNEPKFSCKFAQVDSFLRGSAHTDEFRFGSVQGDERAASATPGDDGIVAGEDIADAGVALGKDVSPGGIAVSIYDARKMRRTAVLSAVAKWKGLPPLQVAENLFGVGEVGFARVGQVAREDRKGVGDFGDSMGLEIKETANEFLVGFLEGGGWVEGRGGELLEGFVSRGREGCG